MVRGMMAGMYQERPSRVPGAVLWSQTAARAGPSRVLPDGCMDLLLLGGRLVVAGPDSTADVGWAVPGSRVSGLRLAPGEGPGFFGVRACEVRDLRVPLADLWPEAAVRELTEQARESGPRALEEAAVGRLRGARSGGPPEPPPGLVPLLGAGAGVAEAARRLGLGERRLHRRCLDAFGYGPKTLARILRFQRAWALLHARGLPRAEAAHRAGYADQAHLAREFRALAGAPVGVVLAEREPR